MIDLRCGDCLDVMRGMDEACVDTIITDPPYGLEFMGKDWDHGVPGAHFWEAALRVAKPGAFLLAFGGTRTHHRLTCAIEDAGWEIRDAIFWCFGSGFPKSHDISKAIDKQAGAEREVIRERTYVLRNDGGYSGGLNTTKPRSESCAITSPATPAAELWDGWGTALKPAYEIICVAMKPIEGTFAENALKWGVAGLNIDGARIPTSEESYYRTNDEPSHPNGSIYNFGMYDALHKRGGGNLRGRWPANVILDEEAAAALDEMTQDKLHPSGNKISTRIGCGNTVKFNQPIESVDASRFNFGDTGGASRFFYCAKASRRERDAGLEETKLYRMEEISGGGGYQKEYQTKYQARKSDRHNTHPTVKPLALMRYLCTLTMTPTGGVVLDPFMGSGSTGIAAKQTGRNFIGIEIDPGYYEIARRRIERAKVETQLRLEGV